jgi:hypothetical protein
LHRSHVIGGSCMFTIDTQDIVGNRYTALYTGRIRWNDNFKKYPLPLRYTHLIVPETESKVESFISILKRTLDEKGICVDRYGTELFLNDLRMIDIDFDLVEEKDHPRYPWLKIWLDFIQKKKSVLDTRSSRLILTLKDDTYPKLHFSHAMDGKELKKLQLLTQAKTTVFMTKLINVAGIPSYQNPVKDSSGFQFQTVQVKPKQ